MTFDNTSIVYAFLVVSALGYLAILLFLMTDEIDSDDHEF